MDIYMQTILKVLGRYIWQMESSNEYMTHKVEQLEDKVAELDKLLNPPRTAEPDPASTIEKWPMTAAEGLFDMISRDREREKGMTNVEANHD